MSSDYTISPEDVTRLLAGPPVTYTARLVVQKEMLEDAAFDCLTYARRKLRHDVAGAIAAVLGVCPRVTVEIEEIQAQVTIPNIDAEADPHRGVSMWLRCTITPAKKE